MALQGFNCNIKLASNGVAMTDEATTTSDNITYQITDANKRIVDLNTAVTVKDGGVATTEKYRFNYAEGKVIFDSADAGRVITVSGSYVTPSAVVTGKEFTITGTATELENTPFQTNFRTYIAGLVEGTASIGRYHVSDDLFIGELLASDYVIAEFFVNATEKLWAWAIITSDNINSDVDGLVEESIDLRLTKDIGVS